VLLAIDVGNTNTVFAVFEGDRLRGQWRAATDGRRTADEHAVWLDHVLGREQLAFEAIRRVMIASVVPETVFPLRQLCQRYFNVAPRIVGEVGLELGLKINVERPKEVGADRLVNAIAAHARYAGALIVLDFGTATTFDAVGADGAYEGGVIAPGINLSLEALHRAAAQLPRVAVERPARVIGKATVPAMQSGIYWGYVGLIEGIVQRMKAELGVAASTVATGGLAPLFAHATAAIERVDPDLTILGLRELDRRNSAAAP
jgi:type III pantothenate kinase